MKVSELVTLLSEMKQDADVCFDTEAQTYDVHLVSVDEVWPIPAEAIGREAVCLYEDHPHRCDSRAARISQLEAQLGEREAVAQNGHPNPCDLGPMCPYCEIERQKARAESAEQALAATRDLHRRWMAVLAEVSIALDVPCYDDQPGAWSANALAALKSRSEGSVERVTPGYTKCVACGTLSASSGVGPEHTCCPDAARVERVKAESAESALAALTDRANDNAILASQAIDAKSKAEAALASAREELQRERLNRRELRWTDMTPDSGMVTRILSAYIDETTCTDNLAGLDPESLICKMMNENTAQRNVLIKSALAALRRADDAGRVDRAAEALVKNFADVGLRFNAPDTAERIARAVLAAADREGE